MVLTYSWRVPDGGGILEFDYVSSIRPPLNAVSISEDNITKYTAEVQSILDTGRLKNGAFVSYRRNYKNII